VHINFRFGNAKTQGYGLEEFSNMRKIFPVLNLLIAGLVASSAFTQQPATRKRSVTDSPSVPAQEKGTDQSGSVAPDNSAKDGAGQKSSDIPAAALANRREDMSEEEAAVLPYYNNFLSAYRLGPEDVISVSVFGQERYSKANIVVPPDGRIAYPLIAEGIFVAGKTTQQVQDEITKRYDEYIIDPKVSVSLDKAMSARYSVLGDVAQPGIRVMTRRLSVYEAVAEAGGVLSTGDKSKVFVLRRQTDGSLKPFQVNIKDIERGRAKELAFLSPGDQVVVPGNRLKKIQQIMSLASVVSFARIFAPGL